MMNTPVKLTILFLQLLGFILFATGNTAAESPPEEVTIDELSDLYQPIVFDHLIHSENYECSRCHHDSDNDVPTDGCNSCHGGRPINGKKPCTTCHSADIYRQPEGSGAQKAPQYHIDTPALKATWHLVCRNCHVEDDGPTDCQGCHAFTVKGQKLFKVNK